MATPKSKPVPTAAEKPVTLPLNQICNDVNDPAVQSVSDYLRGRLRSSTAQEVELLASVHKTLWQSAAYERLLRRQTGFLDLLSDEELVAVVSGDVDIHALAVSIRAEKG